MITEDYTSFEIAKLLKEKGFDVYVKSYYNRAAEFNGNMALWNYNISEFRYSAPTLQMAMKWLREEHKIEIRVIYDNEELSWYGACNPMNEPFQILLGFGRKSKSYEEACESAVRYCLEKLV